MGGTEPPLCWAHSRYGCSETHNGESRAPGVYDRQLSQQELADMQALAENHSLNSELVLNRIFLRRLLIAIQEGEEVDFAQLTKLAPIIFRGTQAIARLLREERALNGKAADGMHDAIGQALDELSKELGVEL
jgi:hypothetical protein